MVYLELRFCGKIEPRIKTSSKRYPNNPKFNIWCDLIPSRHNMNLKFILRWFA
jgi:hypothetical protein